jgi:hypothetical protein
MRRLIFGLVTLSVVLSVQDSALDAGSKKKLGFATCAAPYATCYAPTCAGCASPGCFGPVCSAPTCGGCSAPGCFAPGCFAPMCGAPWSGCGCSCGGPGYVSWDYGLPPEVLNGVSTGTSGVTTYSPGVVGGVSLIPAYYRPQAPVQPAIPGVPPAEDLAW